VRILVVEDERKMAGLLKRGLEEEGYSVDLARDGTEAVWAGTENPYDAIVLDVMLPDVDGFEVCRQLRSRERWAPVIFLTARDAIDDRVAGLDLGADDYLSKPFSFSELLARLRALIRRGPGERPAVLAVGDLHLDPASHHVKRGGTAVGPFGTDSIETVRGSGYRLREAQA
jgi:two-component system OmpR family response regulator